MNLKLVFLIVYCFIEFIATLTMIVTTISTDEFSYDKKFVSSYLEFIYESLMYENLYNFPLNKLTIDDYTSFGKILFTTLWILFLGIPFIVGCILSAGILILKHIFYKLCFKRKD